MIKTFLIIVLLNEIFTTTFISSFSETILPYIYIGQNNNINIYNPYDSINGLIHFFTENNSLIYSEKKIFQLEKFTQISTNESKIANGYFLSSPTTSNLNVFYFNESYYFSFTLKNTKIYSYYISLESIGPENLILFENANNDNTIYFLDFNYNFTSENINMYIKNKFILNEKTERTNCYCALTSTNKTVCGLIKFLKKYSYYYDYYYTLISLNENTITYSEKLIYNGTFYSKTKNYENNGVLTKFIKLVPLEDEKILYCFEEKGIICSLIKLEAQNMTILINQTVFSYDSGTKKNIFSAIKYKDNQLLLGLLNNNIVYIKKITILSNNTFLSEDNKIKTSISSIFYLKLLKNNYEDIILITVSKKYIDFRELSYSTCNNVSKTIYNGDKVNLNFDISPSINNYNNSDNIIIINNGKELNSLVVGNEEKKLKLSEVYNKNDIFFKISSQDLDEINKYKKYSFEYSNSLNETISQRCFYTLTFKGCKSECDICTSNGNCYDKNFKSIVFRTDLEKYFIILPASILGMLIVLIFFSFAKCCMKEKMPNFGENAIVSEMPLITE